MKRFWEDTWQYKRILEILNDYWLTQKDEEVVYIELQFRNKNGERQIKTLKWVNPELVDEHFRNADPRIDVEMSKKNYLRSLSEIKQKTIKWEV